MCDRSPQPTAEHPSLETRREPGKRAIMAPNRLVYDPAHCPTHGLGCGLGFALVHGLGCGDLATCYLHLFAKGLLVCLYHDLFSVFGLRESLVVNLVICDALKKGRFPTHFSKKITKKIVSFVWFFKLENLRCAQKGPIAHTFFWKNHETIVSFKGVLRFQQKNHNFIKIDKLKKARFHYFC